MRKLVTICAVVVTILAISGAAQAAIQTYSIVDYPLYQTDIVTGLTDHVSGTILADPTTGLISSASFTITGAASYTVTNAVIDGTSMNTFVHISPTQITVEPYNPTNPLGYGYLMLSNGNSGSTYPIEQLSWYTPGQPWVVGSFQYSSYMGAYTTSKNIFDGDFASDHAGIPFTQGSVTGTYDTIVVATVIPEPATMGLLGLGGFDLPPENSATCN